MCVVTTFRAHTHNTCTLEFISHFIGVSVYVWTVDAFRFLQMKPDLPLEFCPPESSIYSGSHSHVEMCNTLWMHVVNSNCYSIACIRNFWTMVLNSLKYLRSSCISFNCRQQNFLFANNAKYDEFSV